MKNFLKISGLSVLLVVAQNFFAAQTNQEKQVELNNALIKKMKDLEHFRSNFMISEKICNEIVQYLQQGADTGVAVDHYGNTPLIIAAKYNFYYLAQKLLVIDSRLAIDGRCVDRLNNAGDTALVAAIINNHVGMIKLLLNHRANINTKDRDGNTPLMRAIIASYADASMIKLLIDHSADINATNNSGETPLMLAIKYSNEKVVLMLLDQKAHVNVQNNTSMSPLSVAVDTSSPKLKIMQLLLDWGADPNMQMRSNGQTILHSIGNSNANGVEIINILLKYKIALDVQDFQGNTALCLLTKRCLSGGMTITTLNVIALLLKNGANPFIINKKNESPISLMSQKYKALQQTKQPIDPNQQRLCDLFRPYVFSLKPLTKEEVRLFGKKSIIPGLFSLEKLTAEEASLLDDEDAVVNRPNPNEKLREHEAQQSRSGELSQQLSTYLLANQDSHGLDEMEREYWISKLYGAYAAFYNKNPGPLKELFFSDLFKNERNVVLVTIRNLFYSDYCFKELILAVAQTPEEKQKAKEIMDDLFELKIHEINADESNRRIELTMQILQKKHAEESDIEHLMQKSAQHARAKEAQRLSAKKP